MRRNHYLIEFRFHGYAKKYLKELIYDVARKFKVKGVTRKRAVPHVTLFGPCTTSNERKLVSEVVSAVKNYYLVPFKLKRFDRFGKEVIYVDVEPSEELKSIRRAIAKRLLPFTESDPKKRKIDSPHDFAFHATIAFKDIERKFDRIWNYIKRKEEPNINQHLLRVTILKNSKILYEYDLMLRKLLKRRQSLSKKIWKKTVETYHMKVGISVPKENLFDKVKDSLTRLLNRLSNKKENKKRIFLISDLHLDHTNIIKYCNRPFKNRGEMNKRILKNWNSTVKTSDIVYFLGDMSFGKGSRKVDYWLNKLKGKIIFIKGSHDKNSKKIKFFKRQTLTYKGYKFLLIHDPKYAPKNWNDWIIHGHYHNNNMKNYPFIYNNGKRKTINVSVELINYKPVNIDFLLSLNIDSIKRMNTINSKPERW